MLSVRERERYSALFAFQSSTMSMEMSEVSISSRRIICGPRVAASAL